MGEVSTIGVDIAKSVFQVHGVDADGAVVIRKRVGRAKVIEFFANLPSCLIGMEACATAHQWARELKKLGHDVRLMPPTYVKAYVKRGKNDAADAAAICEGVTRPSMRFVPIKSVEQQSTLMATRDLAEGIAPAIRSGILAANAIADGTDYELGSVSAYSLPPGLPRRMLEYLLLRRGTAPAA